MFLLSLGGTSWLSAPSDLLRALTQSSKFVWARSVAESVLEPKLLKSELNPKLGEQGAHRGLTWCLRRIQAKQLFMMAAYHPCWMAACSSSALRKLVEVLCTCATQVHEAGLQCNCFRLWANRTGAWLQRGIAISTRNCWILVLLAGSGKTYTMGTGQWASEGSAEEGIVPKAP